MVLKDAATVGTLARVGLGHAERATAEALVRRFGRLVVWHVVYARSCEP